MSEVLKVLKKSCVAKLRSNIKNNLDNYRNGDFSEMLDVIEESNQEIDYSKLGNITGDFSRDVDNAVLLHEIFKEITLPQARDERLWVYLTHGPMLNYTRARFTIRADDDEAVKDIISHFFAGQARTLESRNAVSRLYWIGQLASQIDFLEKRDVISIILHDQDRRANIIERPSTLTSKSIFAAVIKELKNGGRIGNRNQFRNLVKSYNEYCGDNLLEALGQDEVDTRIKEMAKKAII